MSADSDNVTAPSSPVPASVAARLAEPGVEQALHRLIDRLDKVEAMVDALGTFGQRIPVIAEAMGDTAAWAYDQAKDQGIEPIEAGQRAASLALTAAKPEVMDLAERLVAKRDTLGRVLDALDAFDDEDISAVTTALVETRKQHIMPVTPLMALFKMSDPDLQRAIGFTIELGKKLGRILRDNDPN